ncbi:hypothetical protein DLAC_05770 [Tieghemostelium lacteum]|uniref:CHCH domain-containing protein n=1 Tax=Tieghemostelium lacteum TaxID=361077 RepID=A0A151ZGU3_TIELA|nr:hypothetical protein DLAC_05770 [Tieghemostelium lacteum]|eukprot:KYQ93137.1 hypothetical protein DLAC_05770 [Tieghemostelium lacteum]
MSDPIGTVLNDFFRLMGKCQKQYESQPNGQHLVSACVFSTFCPTQSEAIFNCYSKQDADFKSCFNEEVEYSKCYSSLLQDPTTLSKENQIKFSYISKLPKTQGQ